MWIIWLVPPGVTTSVRDGASLIVSTLDPEAAGLYVCVATNGISSDRRAIILTVPNNNTTNRTSSAYLTPGITSPTTTIVRSYTSMIVVTPTSDTGPTSDNTTNNTGLLLYILPV